MSADASKAIVVYPNPAFIPFINIQFNNAVKGLYKILLVNELDQTLINSEINNNELIMKKKN